MNAIETISFKSFVYPNMIFHENKTINVISTLDHLDKAVYGDVFLTRF